MIGRTTSLLAALLACSSLTWCASAQAETAGPQMAPSQSAPDQSGQQNAGSQASPTQTTPANRATGDIVVTALRKSQSVQRTPAAVTAISGENLERAQITDVRGLQTISPGTRFNTNYNSTRIYIRGVGSQLDFYWIPELTATNLNGVYMPRYTVNGALYDIDSVQLLPGPQGVLYGRSAGGGALLINSRRPTFTNEEAASLDLGNYRSIRAELMGNVRLSDTLALRAAGFTSRHDGYESNGMLADDSLGGRLSALWKPTTDFNLFLWGTYFRQDGTPPGTPYIPFLNSRDPWYIPPTDPLSGNTNFGGYNNFAYALGGYEAQYQLGGAKISYRGSYLHQTEVALTKLTGNDRLVNNAQRQVTQDLSISGDRGILSLIGGLSFLHSKSDYDTRFGVNQLGNIFPGINIGSFSVFGQGTLSPTHSLRFTGGARWSRDHLDVNGTAIACFAVCVYPPITFDHTWYHVDWKASAEFDLTDQVLLYASAQTGYAPGTFNTFTNIVGLPKEIRPQTLMAYTGGVKSQLFDRVVTLNLEAYDYEYKDLVLQAFNAQLGQQTLYNAPKARVYGAQGTLALRPWTGGSIAANVGYTHGRYGSFRASPAARDIEGLQMQFAPDWTGAVTADQRFELASGGHLDAHANLSFSSSYWGTFDHTNNARQGSYSKTDASITWYSPDDKFSVEAYVRNIGNVPVRTTLAAVTGPPPITALGFLEAPRTFGARVGFRFQ